MSIVQVKGSGGVKPTERDLFTGARIPEEIKALPKLLKNLDKPLFRKFLKVLVQYYEGAHPTADTIQELADSLSEAAFSQIFSGLDRLLRAALRQPQTSLKQEMFQEDLAVLKIPADFIPDLASVVFGTRRSAITSALLCEAPSLPRLDSFRWRVDVSISTSVLSRVLEPTILAEMKLSDGKLHTFEIPVSRFHELRYSVAQILRDMDNLESRSILKIHD